MCVLLCVLLSFPEYLQGKGGAGYAGVEIVSPDLPITKLSLQQESCVCTPADTPRSYTTWPRLSTPWEFPNLRFVSRGGSIPLCIRQAAVRVQNQTLSRDNCGQRCLFIPNQVHVRHGCTRRVVKSQYPYLVDMACCLMKNPLPIRWLVRIKEKQDGDWRPTLF